jgi:RNA polymerase primary sigma factor
MLPIQDKILPAHEQIILAIAAKDGDSPAMEMLLKANIRYIANIAKQYVGQGVDLDDLISEGIIGFLKAIDRFDASLGNRFITYAGWWIKQGILQALTEHGQQIRIPANRIMIHEKVKRETARLGQKNQREPSTEELATSLDIKTYEITPVRNNFSFHVESDDHKSILETTPDPNMTLPDEQFEIGDVRSNLGDLLAKLTRKEEKIVRMSFGFGYPRQYTLEEIGREFDLTRERARQIKEAALKKIKTFNLKELYDK